MKFSKKLAAGESFESLAKVYSQDLGSAKMEGSRFMLSVALMTKHLRDTLFLECWPNFEVIKRNLALHLIRLLDARKLEIPSSLAAIWPLN